MVAHGHFFAFTSIRAVIRRRSLIMEPLLSLGPVVPRPQSRSLRK